MSTTVNENQNDGPDEPKSNGNVDFGLNINDEQELLVDKPLDDEPLSIQYRALFEQRYHIQKRQLTGNLKFLLCPLIGILVMLWLFSYFDSAQQQIEAKMILNDAKKRCQNCHDVASRVANLVLN